MKRVYTYFLLSLLSFCATSQTLNYEWTKVVTGFSAETGNSIVADENGNIYTIGKFGGTPDFDPGTYTLNIPTNGLLDFFIQKLDENGDLVWACTFGDVDNDNATAIKFDQNGNLIITGFYEGTVDFDPGTSNFHLTSGSHPHMFVLKLDANGNFMWAKDIGGEGSTAGNDLAVDNLNNIYLTGNFQFPTDFDPGVTEFIVSPNASAMFVLKLDSNGDFVWVKTVDGTSAEEGLAIDVNDNSELCITGTFFGTVDFDSGTGVYNLTSNGNKDIFVMKLDNNGDFLWAGSAGGLYPDYGNDIAFDSQGNVVLTGYYYETIDFDPGSETFELVPIGSGDIFLWKLDANGLLVWAHTFGGESPDVGSSVFTDNLDNIYFTGNFQGTADFDPGTSVSEHTANARDAFMIMLDEDADLIWDFSLGGTYDQKANSIFVTESGIYTTGQFKGITDFDPGVGIDNIEATNTFDDCFIHKLSKDVTGINQNNTTDSFAVYPNPCVGKFVIQSNNISADYVSVYNAMGEEVFVSKVLLGSILIDISKQPAGIYFVKISFGNNSIVEKMVIK